MIMSVLLCSITWMSIDPVIGFRPSIRVTRSFCDATLEPDPAGYGQFQLHFPMPHCFAATEYPGGVNPAAWRSCWKMRCSSAP